MEYIGGSYPDYHVESCPKYIGVPQVIWGTRVHCSEQCTVMNIPQFTPDSSPMCSGLCVYCTLIIPGVKPQLQGMLNPLPKFTIFRLFIHMTGYDRPTASGYTLIKSDFGIYELGTHMARNNKLESGPKVRKKLLNHQSAADFHMCK